MTKTKESGRRAERKLLQEIEEVLRELGRKKENHRKAIVDYLESIASWLASLPNMYLRVLIEKAKKNDLARERDIRKAVALGKGKLPAHVYPISAISLKTWNGLPPQARVVLSSVRNKVTMKKRSKRVEVSVGDLRNMSDSLVRQIISGNWPCRGILDPDDDTPRAREPDYFTLTRAVKERTWIVLTASMPNGTFHRIRSTEAELTRLLASVKRTGHWSG